MSIRRAFAVFALLFAFAVSMSAPLSTPAAGCDDNGGGLC